VVPYATRVKKSLVRDALAVVPGLWHLEMANGLAVAERRGILTAANATAGIVVIEQLLAQAIESSTDFVSIRQALTTARTLQLSAYDAVYLETARRERLPLATLDRKLLAAAHQAGLEIFP
jgi:predicted nucleic acid-binding protein